MEEGGRVKRGMRGGGMEEEWRMNKDMNEGEEWRRDGG